MDLHYSVKYSPAIVPVAAAITDNTAQVSLILDCSNFGSNELVITTGVLADADATFTLLLEESADPAMAGANTVAAEDELGTIAGASFVFSDDNKCFKVGYKGTKRYIRATITPANNTGAAPITANWVQSDSRVSPAV